MANEVSSVRVDLKRLADARIIWLNKAFARADPNLADPASVASFAREDAYRTHLIKSCSYFISGAGAADAQGWADRYGGSGIGSNGGSGRSIILNGYAVKGVGATPLIGVDAPLTHSSGGAYLEEAIREILFSEFLRDILPHGASPVLAVIDSGIDQEWQVEGRIEKERRVLIVRPFSLRPAHFERAYHYRPASYAGKRADKARVEQNFHIFSDLLGTEELRNRLESCYVKWAGQLAFSLVHKIALGSSPSNVTLDGEALDFGASSTLPMMANYFISPGSSVIGDFGKLLGSLEEVSRSAIEFDHDSFDGFAADTEENAVRAYEKGLVRELLAAIGLGPHYEAIEGNERAREKILNGFFAYHRSAARLRLDLLASQYRIAFPAVPRLQDVWSSDRPTCLEALAGALEEYLPSARRVASPFPDPWPATRESLREEISEYVRAAGRIDELEDLIAHFRGRLINSRADEAVHFRPEHFAASGSFNLN